MLFDNLSYSSKTDRHIEWDIFEILREACVFVFFFYKYCIFIFYSNNEFILKRKYKLKQSTLRDMFCSCFYLSFTLLDLSNGCVFRWEFLIPHLKYAYEVHDWKGHPEMLLSRNTMEFDWKIARYSKIQKRELAWPRWLFFFFFYDNGLPYTPHKHEDSSWHRLVFSLWLRLNPNQAHVDAFFLYNIFLTLRSVNKFNYKSEWKNVMTLAIRSPCDSLKKKKKKLVLSKKSN